MPRLKELLHDECGCRLDGPIYLYVGKAVKLRNRLMGYTGGRRLTKPPPWVEHFTVNPHSHFMSADVWYLDRPIIAAAEGTLIEALKPLMNVRDKDGFGGSWKIRKPDLTVGLDEVVPDLKREEVGVWVEDRPGVYVWSIDPGDDVICHGNLEEMLLSFLNDKIGDQERIKLSIRQCKAVKEAFAKRALNKIFDEQPNCTGKIQS